MKHIIEEYGHILLCCAIGIIVLGFLTTILHGQLATTVPDTNIVITNTNEDYLDIPKPVIHVDNPNVKLTVGDTFDKLTTPGVSASDERDGNLTTSISIYGNVNPDVAGVYKLRYVVSNRAGLKDEEYVKIIVEP